MKHSLLFPWFVLFAISAAAQDDPIRIDFSGSTAEENGVTVMGAGFGDYPLPSITFGSIPTDNAFEGATDGEGASIVAAPGEGILIIGSDVAASNPAMIRCSVRTNNPNVSVIIASLDNGPHTFVSTQTVNDAAYFLNQYKRLTTFYVPSSGSFKPLIQVINTSESETAVVMLDNFDVFIFDPERFYSTGSIDGDETDPSVISVSEDYLYAPVDEATPTPTPTSTPLPVETPSPIISDFTSENITIPLDLPDGAKPLEMVLIPAGTFLMGSPDNEKDRNSDETPQHAVTLTRSFYMGKYEITQAQWYAVMGNNPPTINEKNLSVNIVSWTGCQKFILNLSEFVGVNFRLPTEAEWEYACRAGNQTAFYWGEDSYNKTNRQKVL
ncbi:MAG: formylglycine-generating enzyme family protein [Candidatus Omnitrophica bacterium]|nr:formylglycine-generating enzyme family protein [Candidatus Omnitrophota bacterium]